MKRVALYAIVATGWVAACGTPALAGSGLASYDRHTDDLVTAARYEPRGSVLRVVEPRSGRSVVVRVNDRGPFNGGRVLDLSTGAFRRLFGGLGRGVGHVNYEVISGGGYTLSSRGGYSRRHPSGEYGRGWHQGWSHHHYRHHWHHRHWR